ncbi:MAG: hypothetical protein H7Y03_02660 [Chitinophagaceae bacterium]|nr:hypothetical protein [Chitinophagaceae bacterium]
MKTIMLSFGLLLTAFTIEPDLLTGRWQSPVSPKGNVTTVVFKADNTFEGFVNNKPFVSGSYKLQDSVFTMQDNGCNGVVSMYKPIFFSNNDSLRFELIMDSCINRSEGVKRLVLGRVK